MPYDISWLVENQVINLVLDGEMTVETIDEMSKTIIQYLDSSDKPLVHLLIDDSHASSSIRHIKSVMEVGKALGHPRFGWLIIYGSTNKTYQFMSYLISQITKIRHRRFATLAETLEFLHTVDVTVPRETG
jgi:hypothetical protein